MFEYHGWITIKETTATGYDDTLRKIDEIKMHIIKLNWHSGIFDIRNINGAYHVWISGCTNHPPAGEYCPTALFAHIGIIAPESYGILYIHDSDDMVDENYNKFIPYVLTRGKLIEHKDHFLSPCMPIIESFPLD
jgi:hypothetical protein